MKTLTVVCLAACLLFVSTKAHADPDTPFQVDIGVWAPSFGGTLQNILQPNAAVAPTIEVRWARDKNIFGLGYAALTNSGSTVLSQPVLIGNTLFLPPERVDSKLSFSDVDTWWEHRLLGDADHPLNLLILVKVLDFTDSVSDRAKGSSGTQDNPAVVPFLGLSGHTRLGSHLSVGGRFSILSATVAGVGGTLIDYRAGLHYSWDQHLGVDAEYRGFTFNGLDNTGHPAQFEYQGPQFTANYHF